MIDKDTMKKCKELISTKFKVDDLKFCLLNVGCNVNGRKDELQRRLKNALDSSKTQIDTASVILKRGKILCNVSNFPRSSFIEKKDQKANTSSSLVPNKNESFSGNISMRELYFHKDLVNISQWKRPNYGDSTVSVQINCKIPGNISISSLTSTADKVAQNCILLRSSKILHSSDANKFQEDTYPVLMRMFINGNECTYLLPREICYSSIDRKNRLGIPTVLNEALLANPEIIKNNQSLNVNLYFDKEANKDDKYAFAIFTSNQRSMREICNEIESREKLDYNKFSQDLEKFMLKSSDIQLEFAKISLLSSTTRKRINIPFRGRYCNHLNPDDLEDYIEINRNSEAWKCKICKAICTPDDIFIDEFYMKILSKHKIADEIELYPDMSYKLFGVNDDKTHGKPTIPKKRKTEEEIIVIDSDDEDDVIQMQTPIKNDIVKDTQLGNISNVITKLPKAPQTQIECIIIEDSDEEEEPPQKKTRCNDKETSKSHILQPALYSNTGTTNNPRSPSDGFLSDESVKNDADDDDPIIVLNKEDSIITTKETTARETCPLFKTFIKKIVDNTSYNTTKLFFNYNDGENLLTSCTSATNSTLVQDDVTSLNSIETDLLSMHKNGDSEMVQEYFKKKNDEALGELDKFIKAVEKKLGFIPASSY